MNVLAESKHYIVYSEYETVIMKIKSSQKEVQIGDFYGEPQMAVISKDETFCIMCGCGVIIYYLKEPFKEYEYNMQTDQWKEWGRENEEVWVESIIDVNHKKVKLLTEQGESIVINAK